MEWLRLNGWSVDRTAAWVYVWRWKDGQRVNERRFTSVIRAVKVLKAESESKMRRAA